MKILLELGLGANATGILPVSILVYYLICCTKLLNLCQKYSLQHIFC